MCCQREILGKLMLWIDTQVDSSSGIIHERVSWAIFPMVTLAHCINMPLAEGNVFGYA